MGHVKRKHLEHLFAEIQSALAFDQPSLAAILDSRCVRVEGFLSVLPTPDADHSRAGALSNYHVKILFDKNFPNSEPKVFELGEEIPRTSDYHINYNGTCCLGVWEVWLASCVDPSVQAFFDGPLRNFFLGQLRKKETGDFPFGEHSHGDTGVIEAYAELLGCRNDTLSVRNTLKALTHYPPKGHWPCPCDSGKNIRNCCREGLFETGQTISPQLAKKMLYRIVPSK